MVRSPWLLASLLLAQASGKAPDYGRCRHGTYDNNTQACGCKEHWSTAGITDTIDFLEGACEQYHCQSDSVCQDILGIEEATCPVQGWNCYCGWTWAFHNGGHGFENSKGECMGLMYNFSIWASVTTEFWLYNLWKVVVGFALFALPFGRKRAICDHHNPSMWNGLRRCVGCQSECRGECVMNTQYTLDSFKDDVAWSLYFLDVGLWLYLFLVFFYLTVLFIWSIVLWLAVFVTLISAVLFQFLFCCEGDASGCCGGGCLCDGGGCGDCGPLPCEYPMVTTATPTDAFYWSGAFPQNSYYCFDPLYPYGSDRDGSSSCCSTTWLKPLALLLYVFPGLPENAWGGFFGYYVFGTHHRTPQDRLYTGGSPVIEFFRMGWRRQRDLHGDEAWRTRVWEFLLEEERHNLGGSTRAGRSPHAEEQRLLGRDVIGVGPARAKLVHRPFDLEGDGCFPSSFDDYMQNKCWICQEGKDQWDLWLSCRHLFCKDCSTEMLRRRMPCPLCRVASGVVLRGEAYRPVDQNPQEAHAVAAASTQGSPQPHQFPPL